MSTDIGEVKGEDGRMMLTQFSGGRERGLLLQLTIEAGSGAAWMQMTPAQALVLGKHLLRWGKKFL